MKNLGGCGTSKGITIWAAYSVQNYYRFKMLFYPLHPDNCKGFASSELVIIGKFCLQVWLIALYYVRKKLFFCLCFNKKARTLNLSVYIVSYIESILLANACGGKFTTNLCFYTMSFKVLGCNCCFRKDSEAISF